MADVFISYKRERRPAARHLEQILIRYGYSVWFDLALLRGADYEEQIQRELNAAKAVIVLWCGLSVQSPGVRSESSRAKAQGKLVPVVIEPCELPLFSTLDQRIDLTAATGSPRDHALDSILDDVERLVGRAPVADLKALRDYEATWRTMTGGLPFARLPLEQVASVEVPQPVSKPQPKPPVAVDADAALTDPPVQECDRLAASPNDPNRKAEGVDFENIRPEAVAACRQAVERYPKALRFTYQLGRAQYAGKNFADAVWLFRKAADAGHAGAIYSLGLAYADGKGVMQDFDEAVRLYCKAADAGHVNAIYTLGLAYADGKGVTQDFAEAVRHYRKAADAGQAGAMYGLGRAYANGQGVTQDNTAAAEWILKSIAAGGDVAMNEMKTNSSAWNADFRRALQRKLTSAGLYTGKIDGELGTDAVNRALDALRARGRL